MTQLVLNEPQAATETVFERLARDPNVSVEKIERLMALWERGEATKAEAAFNAAMTTAQTAMTQVTADAYNPSTKSRYASYAALDAALRPIYTTNGFGMSFNTMDTPQPDVVRVLCRVTHVAGHAREYRLDMPADGKGAKGGDVMTKTHATGSAIAYGMRYLLKMIWNVAVGQEDDDGTRAGQAAAPPGFQDWWDDLTAAADNGSAVLERAWAAKGDKQAAFKTFAVQNRKHEWDALKKKAAGVAAS